MCFRKLTNLWLSFDFKPRISVAGGLLADPPTPTFCLSRTSPQYMLLLLYSLSQRTSPPVTQSRTLETWGASSIALLLLTPISHHSSSRALRSQCAPLFPPLLLGGYAPALSGQGQQEPPKGHPASSLPPSTSPTLLQRAST